jgi:hypothetical protein
LSFCSASLMPCQSGLHAFLAPVLLFLPSFLLSFLPSLPQITDTQQSRRVQIAQLISQPHKPYIIPNAYLATSDHSRQHSGRLLPGPHWRHFGNSSTEHTGDISGNLSGDNPQDPPGIGPSFGIARWLASSWPRGQVPFWGNQQPLLFYHDFRILLSSCVRIIATNHQH